MKIMKNKITKNDNKIDIYSNLGYFEKFIKKIFKKSMIEKIYNLKKL